MYVYMHTFLCAGTYTAYPTNLLYSTAKFYIGILINIFWVIKSKCMLPHLEYQSEHATLLETAIFTIGVRWDVRSGTIVEAHLKEVTFMMLVIFAKAIPVDRQETKHT